MTENSHRTRHALRDIAGTSGLAMVVVVIGFVVAYQFVGPAPPQRIVLATGQDGGAYQLYGERLAAYLAEEGIETELRATAGSVENLALLDAGDGVDIGFVQGGLAELEPTDNVMAIGSLYLEPLWLFVSADSAPMFVDALAGRRVAIGAPGSGTRAVAAKLLAAHGIEMQDAEFVDIDAGAVAAAFATGNLDAAFVIGAPESAAVAALITQPGVSLQSLDRSAAYVRRFPYLSPATLPRGVLDLQTDRPRTDVETVALTAMLAANQDLHPALIDLLLIASTEIFGGHSLLADAGRFPTPRYVDLPLSDEAERHFRNGPPFLMKYLPFWAATLIDRLWIMALPLVGLAIPLLKLLPPAYRWRIRRRLLRLYAELEQIDPQVNEIRDADDLIDRLQTLDRLDAGLAIQSLPKSYTDDAYKLRRDIDLVRRRLKMHKGYS